MPIMLLFKKIANKDMLHEKEAGKERTFETATHCFNCGEVTGKKSAFFRCIFDFFFSTINYTC